MVQVPLYNIPSGPYATGGVYVTPGSDVPPVPKIAANTLRFEFGDATYDPTVAGVGTSGTWSRVSDYESNVWDWTNTNESWATAFGGGNTSTPGAFTDFDNNPVRVIGCGDLSGVTDMSRLFQNCYGISEVLKLDTSGCRIARLIFSHCENCTVFPTLDLQVATDTPAVFQNCHSMVNAPRIKFPIGNLYSLQNFFYQCINLETIPTYDLSYANDLTAMFYEDSKISQFPLLNTGNVYNMKNTFRGTALTEMPDLDYSGLQGLSATFWGCTYLRTIRSIYTPSLEACDSTFYGCVNVEQGSLDFYSYLSSIQTISTHKSTFKNCGANTVVGQAELALIPIDWGGLLEPAIAANTLRFEFSDTSYSPQTAGAGSSGTWTKRNEYGSSRNVWDWTRSGSNWSNSFYHSIGDFIDPNNEVSIIGCGDLSAVTNMSYMFTGCSSLVNIVPIDTSHATNVSGIFSGIGCTQLPDLDFSSVTYADGAFVRCENLVTAPNITFPTGHYFTANTMLSKCFSLVSIPLYNFTYCTSMDEFATHCHNLVNVPALNTPNVTSMREAFKNTAITSIPALNYSSVTDTYCMFSGCTSLTTITPINAPRITYAQSMFDGCTNVSSGALDMYNYLLDKVITSQAYENVFLNCGINTDTGFTELEQIPTSWGGKQPNSRTIRFEFGDTNYDPTVAGVGSTGTWTKRDDYDANVWDWYKDTSAMNRVFGSDTEGVDGAFNDIENNPVTIRCTGPMTGVTNMYGMFQRCSGLYSVKHFDTSSVSTSGIAYMFSRCTNCTHYPTLDLSHCNNIGYLFHNNEHLVHAPNLIMPSDSEFSATYLFCNCYLLESVPLYNLSQCTNLTAAFYCCYRLTSLPEFNTQKVTTFSSAVRETAITEMPDWDYSKATSIAYFMYGCYNVTRLRPILNNTALTNVNGAFEYCAAVEQGLYDCYASLLNINTITDHKATFIYCGARTEAGKADIQRVHLDWGGRQNVPAIANNTLRFRFGTATVDPASLNIGKGNGTWQRRTEYTENVWDWTLTGTMRNAFSSTSNSGGVDIIESGSWSGTLDMYSTFYAFQYLYSICDLDLSNTTITDIRYAFSYTYNGLKYVGMLKLPSSVTNIHGLYIYAYNLGYFPEIVVESLTDVGYAFRGNRRIMKGIYDMYEKLSEYNPDETTGCFIDCGINGPSASELDLIPATWGGNRPVLGYTPITDDPDEPLP